MKLEWAIFGVLLLSGCESTDPMKELKDPHEFIDQEYAFLQEGEISREEVLVRLGPPSAQFEGDRIFTYQIVPVFPAGRWVFGAPKLNSATGLREWEDFTCSLVLVFNANGMLERRSLVLPYGIENNQQ